ncbi:MAG: hypothetical protein NTV34_11595 [Proteobacteria bacterium]|nr:hypothetical protein [Pseudomonadota bacterium]
MPVFTNLFRLRLLFIAIGIFMSGSIALSSTKYNECKFQLVDRIGGLFNHEWSYKFNRYMREVYAPVSTPLEIREFYPLIDQNTRGPIRDLYKKTIEDYEEVQALLTPLQETVSDGLTSWFFHYKRRQWGSSAQDSEVTHEFYVDLETLSCT